MDATFQDDLGFLVVSVSPFYLDWGLQAIKSPFLANSIRIAIIPTTSRWEHEEGGEEGLFLPIDVGFPEAHWGGRLDPLLSRLHPCTPCDFSLAQRPVCPASLLPWGLLSTRWGPAHWEDPVSPSFIYLWSGQA